MKRFIVPVISVVIIAFFIVLYKPEVTGMATLTDVSFDKQLNARVSLSTSPTNLLPENAIITVSINNRTASMPVAEFIEKTKQDYTVIEGNNSALVYQGKGFIGNETYYLPLAGFDIDRILRFGTYTLRVKVYFNDFTISEVTELVVIE